MKPESFISQVIADGRVTIPAKIRKEQAIQEGDYVEVQFIRVIEKRGG